MEAWTSSPAHSTVELEENGDSGIPAKRILSKELSFSRLCDEKAVTGSTNSSKVGEEEMDGGDFELPLLHPDGPEGSSRHRQQRSMRQNPPFAVEIERKGDDNRFVPFQVGNGELRAPAASISAAILLKTFFFVLVWYAFSTSLTIYNKTLLGDKLGKFPAPLLMNTVHFSMQAVLSSVVVWFQMRRSENKVKMTWKDYFLRVVPTAVASALDINLSNASLVFITVTFATMCKSASPIFLLVFAFAFRLESPSIRLFGIIFIISIGVFLTVEKETEFELWGFIFVMLAAVMSGFRWSMTQILLQKEAYGLKSPITFMSYVTPIMSITTLVLSLIFDPWLAFDKNTYFDSTWHFIRTCLVLFVGGVLAFLMVLTEYILVSATSAVTVTIAGVAKEVLTIVVAVFYFHDQFTLLKGVGLLIIMVGVSLFNLYKYQKLLKGELANNEETTSEIANEAAKYVILDELDVHDDEI